MKADFQFYKGATESAQATSPKEPLTITVAPRQGLDDPSGYIPGADLEAAVNTALLLGLPLVVTGKPGCGKTQLGGAVAYVLGYPHFKFDTKSTSLAKDIFYTFDVVGRFHAAQIDKKDKTLADPRRYIAYQALGQAILLSHPRAKVEDFLPVTGSILQGLHNGDAIDKAWPKSGFRSVVVIDEVDKAPRDFPNDILNEIEQYYFNVTEFGASGQSRVPAAPADKRPFVVFTSNSEKQLPEAFLRRCIYHHIDDPAPDRLALIISRRLGPQRFKGSAQPAAVAQQYSMTGTEPLVGDAIRVFVGLREGATLVLKKAPGIAELLNWLQSLAGMGADLSKPLEEQALDLVRRSMGALIKTQDDRAIVLDNLSKLMAKANGKA
jgi:MoxR-like ATPase